MGRYVSIRRFFKETLTVDRLVSFGALPPDAAEALHAMVVSKLNILVAGGTGSGKTSHAQRAVVVHSRSASAWS